MRLRVLRKQLRPAFGFLIPRPTLLPAVGKQVSWYSSQSRPSASALNTSEKVTLQTLQGMYEREEPITVLTAHDFPSGLVVDTAGMEVVLVGDSLAMVAMSLEDTNQVTMEEMLMHCRNVSRAVKTAFTIADLPMGSYELSPEQALQSAIRMVKEGGVKAIKLEGDADMARTIEKISRAGIPVMAHVGLTPQRQHSLGGFKVQAKSAIGAVKLLQDAVAVQEAGAFLVLIEAVPAEVAAIVTKRLRIPTIGIGAGKGCSGQVLVQVDMLGNFPRGRFLPKFVKCYADMWGESVRGIEEYKRQVKGRSFPSPQHQYAISKEDLAEFRTLVGGTEE